jgi:hypothetical protein
MGGRTRRRTGDEGLRRQSGVINLALEIATKELQQREGGLTEE